MPKFSKKSKSNPEIPTSALPDIIFMLLFFLYGNNGIERDRYSCRTADSTGRTID